MSEALDIPEEDAEVFALMPTDEALMNRAAKHKRHVGQALNGPNIAEITVPEQLANKDGRPFLIYDSNSVRPGASDRVLVFASETVKNVEPIPRSVPLLHTLIKPKVPPYGLSFFGFCFMRNFITHHFSKKRKKNEIPKGNPLVL